MKNLLLVLPALVMLLASCSNSRNIGRTVVPAGNNDFSTTFVPTDAQRAARLDSLKFRLQVLNAELDYLQSKNRASKAERSKIAELQNDINATHRAAAGEIEMAEAEKKAAEDLRKAKDEAASSRVFFVPKPEDEAPKPKAETKAAAKPKTPESKGKATASSAKPAAKPAVSDLPPRPKTEAEIYREQAVKYENVRETVVGNAFVENDPTATNMYCLHKSAPIGGMVQVTNPMNRKSLSLKCIGRLPDSGVGITITFSAAKKLNLRDDRFSLICSYQKPILETGSK